MRPDQPPTESQPNPRIAALQRIVRREGGVEGSENPDQILERIKDDLAFVAGFSDELSGVAGIVSSNWEHLRHEAATGDDSDRKYQAVLDFLDELRGYLNRLPEIQSALQRIASV